MVFIHGVRDVPITVGENARDNHYFISYKFLGHHVKYKLEIDQAEEFEGMLKIKMDKIKVMYFFAESREQIKQFVK